MAGRIQISVLAAGLVLLAGAGCRKPVPPAGALVMTQSPVAAAATPAADILDLRYPPGSRVVLMEAPPGSGRVQVLSEGLAAAGDPVVSYDGQRVFFVGKAGAAGRLADLSGRFGGRASSNADFDARRRDKPDAASERKSRLRLARAKNRRDQFQPAAVLALCSIARRPAAPVDLQLPLHRRADDAGRWQNPVCLNPTAGILQLRLRPGAVHDQQRRHGNHRLRRPGRSRLRHPAAPAARRWPRRLSGFNVRLQFGGICPHGPAVSKPRAAVSRCDGARQFGGGREQWRFAGVRRKPIGRQDFPGAVPCQSRRDRPGRAAPG